MIRIRNIDHIVLRTANPEAMIRFYREVLACPVERELPPETGLVQLRAGNALIDIVPVDSELGRLGGGPPGPDGNNLDHFCLDLEEIGQDQLRAWLESHGVACGEFQRRYGATGFGPSLYIEDPDGNTVELRGAV
jgi:glyoxylase I family protein